MVLHSLSVAQVTINSSHILRSFYGKSLFSPKPPHNSLGHFPGSVPGKGIHFPLALKMGCFLSEP